MSAPRRLSVLLAAGSVALLASGGLPTGTGRAVAAVSLAPPVVRAADLHDVSPRLADLVPVRPPVGREGFFEPELPDRLDGLRPT